MRDRIGFVHTQYTGGFIARVQPMPCNPWFQVVQPIESLNGASIIVCPCLSWLDLNPWLVVSRVPPCVLVPVIQELEWSRWAIRGMVLDTSPREAGTEEQTTNVDNTCPQALGHDCTRPV